MSVLSLAQLNLKPRADAALVALHLGERAHERLVVRDEVGIQRRLLAAGDRAAAARYGILAQRELNEFRETTFPVVASEDEDRDISARV